MDISIDREIEGGGDYKNDAVITFKIIIKSIKQSIFMHKTVRKLNIPP